MFTYNDEEIKGVVHKNGDIDGKATPGGTDQFVSAARTPYKYGTPAQDTLVKSSRTLKPRDIKKRLPAGNRKRRTVRGITYPGRGGGTPEGTWDQWKYYGRGSNI